tara:strand:- start:313 stop:444 length:132 start_codon:yes stop_codon:yes gene_type:complete
MEQLRIRQPKIEAAQSFIQILEAFLTKLLNFQAPKFTLKKNIL